MWNCSNWRRKAVVLKLAFDTAIAGDDAPVPVHQRPEAERIKAEADPYRALELFADGVARRAARTAPIYGAIVEAAGADAQAKQRCWRNSTPSGTGQASSWWPI